MHFKNKKEETMWLDAVLARAAGPDRQGSSHHHHAHYEDAQYADGLLKEYRQRIEETDQIKREIAEEAKVCIDTGSISLDSVITHIDHMRDEEEMDNAERARALTKKSSSLLDIPEVVVTLLLISFAMLIWAARVFGWF